MSILQKIDDELKAAMKGGDKDRLAALRLIKTDLKREEMRLAKELPDEAAQAALRTMVKQRKDSIEQFRQGGRADLAAKEESELAVIESFLPKAMDAAEMERIVDGALAELGPLDPKKSGAAIGKVMAALKATGLSFDGKAASELVRKRMENA